MGTDDTRDRLIQLEVEVRHLTNQLESVSDKVSDMHDVLMKARGAQWVMLGVMTGIGFLAAKFGAWFGFAK